MQLDRRCGGGVQAIVTAAMMVQTGAADVVMAGGVESMSNVEYYTTSMRWGSRAGSVPLHDRLVVEEAATGITLTCDDPALPCDGTNLVHRAASKFLAAAGISAGVRIHLEKRLPLAAGLGGGSANAAVTLRVLDELFGGPLDATALDTIAATLGSDVNFFLQPGPALAGGRGERIIPLAPFTALRGCAMFLFHPGFGIPTPWAFKELARFPGSLNGRPGRAAEVAGLFLSGDLTRAGAALHNSLEAPVLERAARAGKTGMVRSSRSTRSSCARAARSVL